MYATPGRKALPTRARSPFAGLGGIVAGNGAALLRASRLLARHGRERGVCLLREPRSRTAAVGRGLMDARDFYVA